MPTKKYKKIIGLSLIVLSLIGNLLAVVFLVKNITFPGLILGFIFVCGILIISLGWLLILKPEFQLVKAIKSKKIEILLAIVILAICDFSLSFVVPRTYVVTCREGWCLKSGKLVTQIRDTPTVTRRVTANYGKNGFRIWGDESDKTKKRVLVLGDSYTQTLQVNDGEEWFAYLQKAFPDANFFVYGSNGYGSLQEYMILQDYIDEINPDVIIWQFCQNDYGNNYYPLSKTILGGGGTAVRPFLENEKIVYRSIAPLYSIRQYSFVLDKVMAVYDNDFKLANPRNISFDQTPADLLDGAKKITEEIFEKIGALTVGRKVYMFSAGPMGKEELKLCEIANINCIKNVWENVMKQNVTDDPVKVIDDGHWNLRGNKLAGQELINYFKNNHALSN